MKLDQSFANQSLSHATLKTNDLLKSFLSFLYSNYDVSDRISVVINNIYDDYNSDYSFMFADEDEAIKLEEMYNYYESVVYSNNYNETEFQKVIDDFQDMLDRITDLLNEISPAGYYFGTTEGDGSDFGFWYIPDYEIEDDEESFRETEDNMLASEYGISVVEEKEYDDEYILAMVATEAHGHGDFFKALCTAYKLADGSNRKILKPAMIDVMSKLGVI